MRRLLLRLALPLLLVCLPGIAPPAVAAPDRPAAVERDLRLSDNVDVTLRTFPAQGQTLLLWVAPGFGFHAFHERLAARLAAAGTEVWLADMAEALFLPRGSGGMRQLSGRYVADLVERAHAATGKKVVLVSSSYGAIPVLRGAREWQTRAPQTPYLLGALLFSPNTYATIPELGLEPEYLPIVHATNIPVYIVQGGAGGNRWQLPKLVDALGAGGAPVYVQVLPGVVGLFTGHEPNAAEQRQRETLPRTIARALHLLAATPTPLTPRPLQAEQPSARGKGLDAELRPYQGPPQPHAIALPDAKGRMHRIGRKDYRGRVTVVNFWATWCPPCVEEIPSLNRLKQAMGDQPFQLVSVNYAQGGEAIASFMRKVQVDFTVLVDADGSEAAQWNVIAFPSTFVVGPDGRIRYGVNAAIHWDSPEVIATLKKLAAEATTAGE